MIVLDLATMKPLCAEERPPLVLCLGNFDGVHRGHASLIEATKLRAEMLRAEIPDVRAGAWCFAVSPRRYLGGEKRNQITSLREKLDLMAALGLDYVCLGNFETMRHLSPQSFICDVLKGECHSVSVVCGFNHRFGRGGEGKPSDLTAAFGERAITLPPVNDMGQGVVISSSRIRTLLAEGQMEAAVQLLGHPFVLRAPVVHGKALGRTIGLPTANQNFPASHLIPAVGIYATRVRIGLHSYIGVTNVGSRPTVQDNGRINCETHILDFNGSLYGQVISVEFYCKLRDERKFDGLAALTEAIRADAMSARRFFEKMAGGEA